MELHRETGEAFAHTVDDQKRENAMLKQRIVELEVALIPRPLLVEHISIVHLVLGFPSQAYKIYKVTQLLSRIRSFVLEGIKSQEDLITEAFETMENVQKMGTHIRSFKELLTSDIKHDEDFFLNYVSTFALKVQSLTEEAGKKQSLPTIPRIKQIQSGWKGGVDIIKSLKENATLLEDTKSAIFFKLCDAIN